MGNPFRLDDLLQDSAPATTDRKTFRLDDLLSEPREPVKLDDLLGPPPETSAVPAERKGEFDNWVKHNQVADLDHPDSHYDYRGAFLSGVNRGPDGHWPDTFKQHGHPTFSVQSQYSTGPNDGGNWNGDQFVPAASEKKPVTPQPAQGPSVDITPRSAAQQDREALRGTDFPRTRGFAKAVFYDTPRSIASMVTEPVRAAFAPETIEEARNAFLQGAKMARGESPTAVRQDVHDAIRHRVGGAETPDEVAGGFAKSFVTAGRDVQRAAMPGPNLGNLVYDYLTGQNTSDQIIDEERQAILATEQPEAKTRALTNLGMLGALTSAGARSEIVKGENPAGAKGLATRAHEAISRALEPRPTSEVSQEPKDPPGGGEPAKPTIRERIADAINPEGAEERRAAQRAAETDPLTGVGNRAAFDRARVAADADQNSEFVVFDVNNLKAANDLLGHEHGDAAITQASTALARAAAEAKVPERVFRLGGDEFAAVVPKGVGDAVRQAAERIYGERTAGEYRVSLSGHVGSTFAEADAGLQTAKAARKGAEGSYRTAGGTAPAPNFELPKSIVRMRTSDISADPARFQFKQLGEEGVGAELKGVKKWNEKLAGVLSVWRDPESGKVYVVNGHHRLDLANRLDVPEMNVQFIDAPTAQAARAEGAFINIAEGRGTATDVAKFLRDMRATPDDLAARGVSLRGDLARDGLALSKLAPDVFDQVATQKVPQTWGVAIGSMLEEHVLQRDALKAAQSSGKRLSQAEVTEVARQVRDAGTEAVQQETIFGSETERHGLFVQKAQLATAIKKRLAGDKRLFGFVAKEGRAEQLAAAGETKIDVEAAKSLAEGSARSAEIFDRLYTRSGPLADLMNDAARRIARGEKSAAVADDIYPAVGDAVARELAVSGARPDGGERPVSQGARSVADEVAADEATRDQRVADSQDPDQSGFLSPEPNKFQLSSEPEGPGQRSMFGGKEGTAASRSLSQTERAAQSELEQLRARYALEKDPGKRQALAAQIAEREKLLNRNDSIKSDELKIQIAAEGKPVEVSLPDQMDLLSPDLPPDYVGKLKKVGAQAPSPVRAGEVKTLMEISRGFAEALGAPLRQGRFNAAIRKALGVFFPKSEVSRVTRFDRLDVVAHEAGHYISKKWLRNPTMKGAGKRGALSLPKEAARELVQMGRDLYGSRRPNGGYGEEGIAEWVKFYVTDPVGMAEKAPRFTAFMQDVLQREPLLRAALDQSQERYATYQKVPAAQRVDAQLSVGEKEFAAPTFRAMMRTVFDDTYDVQAAVKELGGKQPPSEDAGTLARLMRGTWGEAEEWLRRGVHDIATADQRLSGGVVGALEKVWRAGRAQDWRRYVAGESALERWGQNIDPGISRADAEAMVQQYGEDPLIKAAAEAAWEHSRALLQLRRDAGLITDTQYQLILKANQKRVGFYRVFEADETAASKRGGKGGLSSSGIMRQHGSGRRIVDPVESIIRDTYMTAQKVRQHQAVRALVDQALSTEGGGRVVEEVPAPQRPVTVPLSKIQQQLSELGIVYEGTDAKTGEPFTVPLREADIDALLRAFEDAKSAGRAEAKDLVFPMLRNGEYRWFAVKDKPLYDALVGLGPVEMDIWRRALSFPKRLLQTGATTTLEFGLGNLARDMVAQSAFSRGGWRPPLWRHLEGLYHILKEDPVYQRFKLHGGDQATMGGVDRGTYQLTSRRLFGYFKTARQAWLDRSTAWSRAGAAEKAKMLGGDVERVVLSPFEAIRAIKEMSETMGRVGEFAAVERKATAGGAKPVDAATEGALAARDVGIDFQQLGSATRQVNHVVAFFGAWVRGWAQLGRELRTRPHVVIPRLVAEVTVPSLALYYLQRDDPAYQDMPAWKRDLFWLYVQRGTDQGEGWDGYGSGKVQHIWMFPKPFELGLLFGTLPERAAEFADNKNPEPGRTVAEAIRRTSAPPWIPTAFVPLIENYANRSTFRDRPIVPRSREELDPAEQFAAQTGETSRLLGKALGYSPAKIDNLIRGWTGGAGTYITSGTDALVRAGRSAMGLPPLKAAAAERTDVDPLAELPGIRRFVSRMPAEDAESVERLYRQYNDAEMHRQTWRRMMTEGRIQEAKDYFEKHKQVILSVASGDDLGQGQMGPLRAAYERMQQLQAIRRQVEATAPANRQKVTDAMRRVGATRGGPQ